MALPSVAHCVLISVEVFVLQHSNCSYGWKRALVLANFGLDFSLKPIISDYVITHDIFTQYLMQCKARKEKSRILATKRQNVGRNKFKNCWELGLSHGLIWRWLLKIVRIFVRGKMQVKSSQAYLNQTLKVRRKESVKRPFGHLSQLHL